LPREVVRVGRDAVVLSLIRPRFGSEVSLGIGDEPIPLGDFLSHRFPSTKVLKHSVDEDDWFAGALLDVFQANPIYLNRFGSLTPGYHRLLPLLLPYSLRHFVACLLRSSISRPSPNGTT
jgi:hypothetical protein